MGGDGETDYNNAADDGGFYTDKEPKLVNAITYGLGADHNLWPAITKGTPYGAYIENDKKSGDFNYRALHTEEADALFFYENMQGDAPRDKFQVLDTETGGVLNPDDKKDGVPNGTYIEVIGHYYSTASGAVGEGDIKYRFMLGKDIKRNCDAERNYHYKLTLKLHGNANDYDWHIDYKDEKPFDIPNPWYVSYLYNHEATMPFKYTPPKGWKVTRIVARIIENPWYPTEVPSDDKSDPYEYAGNRARGNGFLSLHYTDKPVLSWADVGGVITNSWGGFDYYAKANESANDNYFYGNVSPNINRYQRTYFFDGTDDTSNKGHEEYSYQRDGDKYTFNIPLFTRAKVMIKESGYSGNNPYVGYERHAKLEITANIEDEYGNKDTARDTTTVIQVRRIVNPKGVYRDFGNNEDFHVTLLRLPGDDASEFKEFDSDGPWMAEIIGDKNFITLDGRQVVTGSTKKPIKFTIKFNKLNNDRTVRNAVVRVRYHNYTCTHLIFVRQGYDAQAISPSGKNLDGDNVTATKWSTFNMITATVPATDPRDEGSMFKYGNPWWPIDAYCNVYRDENGDVNCGFPSDSQFSSPPEIYFANSDGSCYKHATYAWNISHNSAGFSDTYPIATARDFEQLYLTPHVQFGYGVLYADGATETQPLVNDAYGWYRRDIDGEKPDNKKGMRGMFAYYWNLDDPDNEYTAKNVFFPIGRSGYGHRKDERNSGNNVEVGGALRYACNRSKYEPLFVQCAPMFCSLYRRPGAIYWAQKPVSKYKTWDGTTTTASNDNAKMVGMDINYFTFDVNVIQATNMKNGSDACFMRCIE